MGPSSSKTSSSSGARSTPAGRSPAGHVLGGPGHPGGLRRQRDQVAHTEARKASSAALVSAGFSCCTQCAGALDDGRAAVVGHGGGHLLGRVGHHQRHGVEHAGEEAGGHGVDGGRDVVRALPVGVHVAVEADGPEEAALLEGGRVDVDVGLGDPGRQHVRGRREDVLEARPLPRRVGHQRAGVGHALGAGGVEHGAQEAPGVRLELGLGRPDRLEVEHVEELVGEDRLEDLDRAAPGAFEYGTLML